MGHVLVNNVNQIISFAYKFISPLNNYYEIIAKYGNLPFKIVLIINNNSECELLPQWNY